MGWLDTLFGKPPQERTTLPRINIPLGELGVQLETYFRPSAQEFEENARVRFAEVKYLLKELYVSVSEFNERDLNAEEGHKRLRRIVSTSKNALVQRMQVLVEKLTPPTQATFGALQEYCLNAQPVLRREIESLRKNIAYTGIIMKSEVKSVGAHVQELDRVLGELKDFASNAASAPAQARLAPLYEKAVQLKARCTEIENHARFAEDRVYELSKAKAAGEKEFEFIQKGTAYQEFSLLQAELKKTEDARESLRARTLQLLAGAEKPLKKFLKNSKFPLNEEEKSLLALYLSDPLEASKRDLKASALKELAGKCIQCVENGIIALKEKEKNKRVKALNAILAFNFFDEVFWKSNELQAQAMEIAKRLEELQVSRRVEEVQSRLASVERQLKEREHERASVKTQHAQLSMEYQETLQSLQSQASELLGREVVISP
ncbi:MAG: hypothetical protein HY393_04275 [Candidatus Diapherotrites archaeon]|nr:hypothetical protein [Candidatus Diapherotrites archaeon]